MVRLATRPDARPNQPRMSASEVIDVEPVSKTRAILGEGPIWDKGKLYWVDIMGKRVYTYDPEADSERYVELDQMVGTVVPRAQGGLAVAVERGFATLDEDGTLQMIAEVEADDPRTRFNDGKCDPAGRFWAGTMAMTEKAPLGSLYALEADGTVRKMYSPVTTSNGICWSLDAKTMYYIDSPTREVAAFDYDVATGEIANKRTVIRFAPEDGSPDGMTIDADGNLWVALWDGWCVVCIDPNTGERVRKIDVPVQRVTACAFGGPDLRDLYITTARVGVPEERLAEQPLAGAVLVTDAGVRGVEAFAFAG